MSNFKLRSLLQLRQEDNLFRLLKKDKLLDLCIAFLHEAYDEKENRYLSQDVFTGMLGRFLVREASVLTDAGLAEAMPENVFQTMLPDGYGLVERVWDTSGKEYSFMVATTDLYADIVRLIEERMSYTASGSSLEIRDTIDAVKSVADAISGDVGKQKEALRQKIQSLQKELDALERTGQAKPLTPQEIRQQVSYARKRISNITAFLSRGTASFKEERDAYWAGMSKQAASGGQATTGSVAVKVLSGLDEFRKSDVVRSYESALELLVNPEEQRALTESFERILKNPEARKTLRDEDVNMNAVLRKVARDSKACYEIMRDQIIRLNAYFRSGEAEKNRLLYKKADEILLCVREHSDKIPVRRYLFDFTGWKLNAVSCKKLFPQMPKEKPKLVASPLAMSVTGAGAAGSPAGWRDIRSAGIPEKFRRLLDNYSGQFTLKEYVEEEGTSFGLYEFLTVRFIMVRYMGLDMVKKAMSEPPARFIVSDLAPRDSGYKETEVVAHCYWFDERSYQEWEKDGFRI